MVDFKKRLGGKVKSKPINPMEIYDGLDRAHDKGPLRPAQEDVLTRWFDSHRSDRDVIIKLHTGQGKTLLGLLMLQSRLNAGEGPAVYLCPDNYLIAQTCEQARQFGIKVCVAEDDIPDSFINGTAILVTSVQKMFNGMTKFGLRNRSIDVGTVLMDDAHTCADRIRDACHIRIPRDEQAYSSLKALFSSSLEEQGEGTYAEIENKTRDAVLPVPYWAISGKTGDVAKILAANAERKSIKFAWPLLKNMLDKCQYIFSGEAVEIEPYLAPLEAFGSYYDAKHRIFMSATVTDDAFLVKGLGLDPETIMNPLSFEKETWSGEKMVLLPSLIGEDLRRGDIVSMFARKEEKRKIGIVALTPSFKQSGDWKAYGSLVSDRDTVEQNIKALKQNNFDRTIVLVNRYDGIDLPDAACRILIFDSKPYSENLVDLLQEECRPNSEITLMRAVRAVEQGMGRSVRGEKDYSVVVLIGPELVRLVRDRSARKYLSPQVLKQIDIGIEITDMAKDDIAEGKTPDEVFKLLVTQCLSRDEAWKEFYAEGMAEVKPRKANDAALRIFQSELNAEKSYSNGQGHKASDIIQSLLDSGAISASDKGWYLQECARYMFDDDRAESQRLQVAAHSSNRLLLKPAVGVSVTKLTVVSHGRIERIIDWVKSKDDYEGLHVAVSDILEKLTFGVRAEKFEQALAELGIALGFNSERPDKEWKEGPDNLWALDDKKYLVIECKSEVDVLRAEVNKRETEQMNRSSAWFEKHYEGMDAKRLLIHPAKKIESAAAFTHEVEGITESDLKRIVGSCRDFFKTFKTQHFDDLSVNTIQKNIDFYKLSVLDFTLNSKDAGYSRKLKDLK